MISQSYPHVNTHKNVSYPQVYPQVDLTDIFKIWFGWREVEDSGELSTFIDGVVMSWNFKGACQTSHTKPFFSNLPLGHGVYHPNLYLSNLYNLKAI